MIRSSSSGSGFYTSSDFHNGYGSDKYLNEKSNSVTDLVSLSKIDSNTSLVGTETDCELKWKQSLKKWQWLYESLHDEKNTCEQKLEQAAIYGNYLVDKNTCLRKELKLINEQQMKSEEENNQEKHYVVQKLERLVGVETLLRDDLEDMRNELKDLRSLYDSSRSREVKLQLVIGNLSSKISDFETQLAEQALQNASSGLSLSESSLLIEPSQSQNESCHEDSGIFSRQLISPMVSSDYIYEISLNLDEKSPSRKLSKETFVESTCDAFVNDTIIEKTMFQHTMDKFRFQRLSHSLNDLKFCHPTVVDLICPLTDGLAFHSHTHPKIRNLNTYEKTTDDSSIFDFSVPEARTLPIEPQIELKIDISTQTAEAEEPDGDPSPLQINRSRRVVTCPPSPSISSHSNWSLSDDKPLSCLPCCTTASPSKKPESMGMPLKNYKKSPDTQSTNTWSSNVPFRCVMLFFCCDSSEDF